MEDVTLVVQGNLVVMTDVVGVVVLVQVRRSVIAAPVKIQRQDKYAVQVNGILVEVTVVVDVKVLNVMVQELVGVVSIIKVFVVQGLGVLRVLQLLFQQLLRQILPYPQHLHPHVFL